MRRRISRDVYHRYNGRMMFTFWIPEVRTTHWILLSNIRFKFPLIHLLVLGVSEIMHLNFSQLNITGYCCWMMMLENTWLKRSDNFPKWQFRLLRKGMAEFRDFGHGQKENIISGRI